MSHYNSGGILNYGNLNIDKLPRLPGDLWLLNCSYNVLRTLPKLPDTLRYIWTYDNILSYLPIINLSSLSKSWLLIEHNIVSSSISLLSALFVRWSEDAAADLF